MVGGRFVGPAEDTGDGPDPGAPVILRKRRNTDRPLRSARLSVTALGIFECRINGEVVGDEVLAPGWTSYRHRLPYSTFDVTDLLRPGVNVIEATVAEGWYRGRVGFQGKAAHYGTRLAL